MFSLNDKVMDKNGKIFSIVGIEEKDFGTSKEEYFVMKPSFPYDFNPGYLAYIPVKKSDSLLKEILTEEEALVLIDSIPTLEPLPEISPRERKVFFTKIIATGNRKNIFRVIKSLVDYKADREKANKPFSDFDRRLLGSLKVMVDNEFSLALNIPPEDVSSFILKRTGYQI